jgi:hypothetical protein
MRRGIPLGAALAAILLTAAPSEAAAPTGANYGGETSQQWPVVVQVAKNGKSVTKLVLALTLKCSSGDPIVNRDRFDKLKLSVSGKFEENYGPTTTDNGDGTTTDYRGSVTGKVTKGKVTATSRMSGDFYDATGKLLYSCDSGKVSWTAKP